MSARSERACDRALATEKEGSKALYRSYDDDRSATGTPIIQISLFLTLTNPHNPPL